MKNLTAIVVPTGTSTQDIERAKKAFEINEENVPYILSGMGPHTNEYLKDRINGESSWELDFHFTLWDYFVNKFSTGKTGVFGVDIKSMNSRENLINTFPEGMQGKYALVSYPLHLAGFWILEKKLKLSGKISKDVEIEYVSTKSFFKQSLNEFVYGSLALIKHTLPYSASVPHSIKRFFEGIGRTSVYLII